MTNIIAPKAIIGLGNPGPAFVYNRHNIGFRVLDALAELFDGQWREKDSMAISKIIINDKPVLLIKPQTFMNNSGKAIPVLAKQGISLADILVIHDELELPFGKLALRVGGSARGHNGLRSIISYGGDNFARLRVGISRPENREDVPDYVLQNFREPSQQVNDIIDKSVALIQELYK